jgi:hypothetical protein
MLNILGNVLVGMHHTPPGIRSHESDLALAKILEDHARYLRGELSKSESVMLWKTTTAYAETMLSMVEAAYGSH